MVKIVILVVRLLSLQFDYLGAVKEELEVGRSNVKTCKKVSQKIIFGQSKKEKKVSTNNKQIKSRAISDIHI